MSNMYFIEEQIVAGIRLVPTPSDTSVVETINSGRYTKLETVEINISQCYAIDTNEILVVIQCVMCI